MLEITAILLGEQRTVYPTLLWDEKHAILVDTGYPGQAGLIHAAIEEAGLLWERVDEILFTHHDIDHIGSAAVLQKEADRPRRTLAYLDEKPYIDGSQRPLKLAQLEACLNTLPEPMKAMYERIKSGYPACCVDVDETLQDGQTLDILSGITVIHTPGHTLGHICLYHSASKTLIAGDAFFVEKGILVQAPAFVNYDADLCRMSLQKLSQFDIENVICYHCGLFRGDANQSIAALAFPKD